MNFVELAENIEKIKLSTAGTKHAKNKPLLILYALEQIRANNSTKLYFYEIETPYSKILEEFSVSSNGFTGRGFKLYSFIILSKITSNVFSSISNPLTKEEKESIINKKIFKFIIIYFPFH